MAINVQTARNGKAPVVKSAEEQAADKERRVAAKAADKERRIAAKAAKDEQRGRILQLWKDEDITEEQALKMLAAVDRPGGNGLSCKVSTKGGVSVYGLGRWPTTLYIEQWKRLLAFGQEVLAFAAEHEEELSSKLDD